MNRSKNLRPARLFARGGFGSVCLLLGLLVDPGVCSIRNLAQQQQVVATERIGGLPTVAVLVDADERGVVTNASFSFVFPDGGLDMTDPDLVYGRCFCLHNFVGCCFNFQASLPINHPETRTNNLIHYCPVKVFLTTFSA